MRTGIIEKMSSQDLVQRLPSRPSPPTFAVIRRMAVAACYLLIVAGCATIPDAAAEREIDKPRVQAVAFDNARGPVSVNKNSAIIRGLKSESGRIASCRDKNGCIPSRSMMR